jgi:hypothetical protein
MSAGATNSFQPTATVTLASGTSSSTILLAGGGETVLITNPTASLAYVGFGSDPTLQATVGDTPILPNSKILLQCGPLISYCAAIFGSGSGLVMFTRGDGSST